MIRFRTRYGHTRMIENYLDFEPQIDESAWVHAAATVIGRVRIGPESSIWPAAVLRGDDGEIVIGSQTSVQDGCVVHLTSNLSNTHVGDRVTIGHNATIHGCTIGNDCIIGMGSILLDNARIGNHVIVGAGTLIPMNKEIPDGVLVVGNPFRVVRELRDADREWIDFSWRHYVENARRHGGR